MPSETAPVLEVSQLSKGFGGVQALSDVDFALSEKMAVGLIGPNGAGKTTLVNCVTGAVAASSGDVRFRGKTITRWSTHQRAQAGIVRTFQAVRLFDEFNAIQNVVTGAYRRRAYGITRAFVGRRRGTHASMEREARALLDEAGLPESQWRRPVAELGHGERRLVELARAVAAEPVILCLDEPTAGLNETDSERFGLWLRSRVDQGLTALLVSHDMPLVMRNCDMVVVLSSGERVAYGHPNEVRNDPAVIDAYLGDDSRGWD